ncbi:hypothetical protein BH24GEM3_BH24GEM3_27620 [soil metagenome]|jgi:hypothetical protein|nr:hypothetical protein [Gemmatimonadota bacterium]MDQ3607150.1 hypothetical protein [Gemmatimonadota bacterium]
MAKKKKRDPEKMHRQVQDSLQALPYAVEQHQKEGRWAKAFVLRYLSGPMLRLMNRMLGAQRYRGPEGAKLRQTDKMRRHLEQKQAAIKHVQTTMQKSQKKKKTAG